MTVGTSADLVAAADRAAASGDIGQAAVLLEQATSSASDDPALWLKLAAVRRAAGDPGGALAAVHRALEQAPLNFMALLMRATLLDRMGDAGADEAWAHALAQKPDGPVSPQLQGVLAKGEQRHEQWVRAREERMKSAMSAAERRAGGDEQVRIARFRSNALRRTRPYHSEPTHFHFPGLVEREFHPRERFPWLEALEAATEEIAAEFDAVMKAERAELVPYVQYEAHQPLDQWKALNHNPDWTAIHLLRNGRSVDANARHCPRTIELLSQLPQPQIPGASPNAMFSLLGPGISIPPHVGYLNARLVCHLPLIVPEGCWFRVGAETRPWRRGEAFVFDDTIEHEARNPTAELRVVFICDVWHPDLSEAECEAVAALVSVEGGATGEQ